MKTLKRFLRALGIIGLSRNPVQVRIYQDAENQWRSQFWRSGQIIFNSGEGYHNAEDCIRTANNTIDAFQSGDYTEKD